MVMHAMILLEVHGIYLMWDVLEYAQCVQAWFAGGEKIAM